MKIEHAKEVIKSIKEEDQKLETFTSHKFIGRYIEKFESEYIDLLVEEKKKQDSKKTTDIFREVHRQIAIFLSDNQEDLGISHIRDVKDMNIHYRETPCAEWRF
jgi:hypothetical protein